MVIEVEYVKSEGAIPVRVRSELEVALENHLENVQQFFERLYGND